jgi:exopolysaccharide/PEP-CTERM locus tyrosine autokinase
MSLVEKAISKMRESRPAASVAAERAVGTLVPDPAVHGAASNVAPGLPPVPARIIKIDQDALRAEGLLPPKHQERLIARQYRQIKRPLLARLRERTAARRRSGHTLMLASAVAGEGKTFTSINLAFSLTREKDLRVVLVDADAPKAHISRLLGVADQPGLLDVLKNSALDVESVILGTDVPNLLVLPAGTRTDDATELYSSERMREIIARLGERDPKRVVLFDSPPLLLTTEAQVLAQVAGEVVMVVRADGTPRPVLLEALEHFDKDRPVSLVLNQTSSDGPVEDYPEYAYPAGEPTDAST